MDKDKSLLGMTTLYLSLWVDIWAAFNFITIYSCYFLEFAFIGTNMKS